MTSGSAFSIPNPIAGNDEVIILIHKICKGASGNTETSSLSLNANPIINKATSPTFEHNKCKTNLQILSYIRLPSSIALTMDAKLSSVKTISEASFATSLPFNPIAIPTSAFFKLGESLTPSPVIAA